MHSNSRISQVVTITPPSERLSPLSLLASQKHTENNNRRFAPGRACRARSEELVARVKSLSRADEELLKCFDIARLEKNEMLKILLT